ncbi:heavy metal translocating P-type ATPase [Halococcus hamelinensis]|uniref:Zinc-transporting ATPase n=1 Tax=Halococcus hamelinensis 100A6 TaxID=1132509 RepID=M0MCW3_9EURY|nr:cation-translocating P-type ATPase [Halococcus hamelinensis]EMA42245.1 zinc-transporting ATPase [Halococcus hamelinensis 100A6]
MSTDAGSRPSPGRDETISFAVPDMDCPSCAGKVENALGRQDGVVEYATQPTTGTVSVTYDPDSCSETALVETIEGSGYEVEGERTGSSPADDGRPRNGPGSVWRSRRALEVYTGATFLAVGVVLKYLLPSFDIVLLGGLGPGFTGSDLSFVLGIVAGGGTVLKNGYYSARNRSLDIDFLMTAGILGAVLASVCFGAELYFEGGTLAVLFSVAQLMERYSIGRARNSLDELMELAPETATVRRDGDERSIHVDDVQVGETVVVRPGEKVPVDGDVVVGESTVNQAPVTGESAPVAKRTDDEVFAGTINQDGYLEVRATSTAGENTIARIIEMVEDAQREETDHEQFVNRFADRYTPVIVGLAVALLFVQPLVLGATWRTGFVQGLTLLVLACPCAMVISTPVSVISAITSAARNGVLIKSGPDLEAMAAVDTLALDKTGTLTKGELTVTDVVPVGDATRQDVLQDARSLERRSEHPIAAAIDQAAGDEGVEDRPVDGFESLTGKGVAARLEGERYYVGSPDLFEDLGFDLAHYHGTIATDGGVAAALQPCEHGRYLDLAGRVVSELQAAGKTVVLVGTDERLVGVVGVADEVRPDVDRALDVARDQGIDRVVMLTGDNEGTARTVAERVGVDEYRADLLPEEKVSAVEELVEGSDGVAMVGDGINDAPALATATVGIAMGAAGTDTALETADIALLSDDLTKIPYLVALSRKGTSVIEQNVWGSLAVKALLAVGVPFGAVSVIAAVVIGDMGMSIGVTANAMRLSRLRPDRFD